MSLGAKRAAVIGAGYGGLALGIRLQSAGVDTVIVEARDKPGGCVGAWEKDGFTFDAGPTAITDPRGLIELWALSGRSLSDDVTLEPVAPHWRLSWPDGTQFDHWADETQLRAEIGRINPIDLQGYDRFMTYAASLHAQAPDARDWRALLRAAPALARHQAWRSIHATVSRFVENEKLREALSFRALLTGANPMAASALHTAGLIVEKTDGLWCARGGAGALAAAMATQFERLGGTIRLGDAVARIDTVGDRATGLGTASGWHVEADAVASNADVMHSYRDLLVSNRRGARMADLLGRKRFAPSVFAVHFGVKGSWPGIPHQMVLFGERYGGLFADIFDHGVLPRDCVLQLHHPSVSDPSLAPEGHSCFSAIMLVPHLGRLPIDWSEVGPILEARVLDEVGRRLIPDIQERIVTKFHRTPRDFAADFRTQHGSAFSLEATLAQSGWLRVHNRDDAIPNLYFVGAGTHPGAGIPGVIASARATAALILEDLGR